MLLPMVPGFAKRDCEKNTSGDHTALGVSRKALGGGSVLGNHQIRFGAVPSYAWAAGHRVSGFFGIGFEVNMDRQRQINQRWDAFPHAARKVTLEVALSGSV